MKSRASNCVSNQYVEVIRSQWGFGAALLEPVREDELIIGKCSRLETHPKTDTELVYFTPEYTGELVFPASVDLNRQ